MGAEKFVWSTKDKAIFPKRKKDSIDDWMSGPWLNTWEVENKLIRKHLNSVLRKMKKLLKEAEDDQSLGKYKHGIVAAYTNAIEVVKQEIADLKLRSPLLKKETRNG
jgi:hypothetical protein